jgi:hypothetical protein
MNRENTLRLRNIINKFSYFENLDNKISNKKINQLDKILLKKILDDLIE